MRLFNLLVLKIKVLQPDLASEVPGRGRSEAGECLYITLCVSSVNNLNLILNYFNIKITYIKNQIICKKFSFNACQNYQGYLM